MSVLDKAIGYFSPRLAYRRAQYRMAAQHFDAASTTYRQKNWRAPGGDVNAANFGATGVTRRRARDLVRNSPVAKRSVQLLVDSVVGDGIIPSVEADDMGLKAEIEAIFLEHLDTVSIDAEGRNNLYGLQRLALRTIITDGEVLMLRRTRRASDNLPLPLQIETLEAEFLDDRYNGLQPSGNDEFEGIETDLIGRRQFYRIFRENPEGIFNTYPESRRVPASAVIHGFHQERAKQRRGVTWMAPVMSRLHDLNDFTDAELLKQKIAALYVGFTYDSNADGMGLPGGTDPDDVIDLKPGMFENLPPGREVTFSDPPENRSYVDYTREAKRDIAAGLNTTYEALAMDMSNVTFISGRLGRIEMNRAMSAYQWAMFIPQICQPFGVWLRDALDLRVGQGRDYRIKWTPPAFPVVDPVQQTNADQADVEAGFTSRHRVIRGRGFDPHEIDREREQDQAAPEGDGNENP